MHATRAQAGKPLDISVLQAPWQALKSVAHLRPIRSEADHDRMVTMMITLLDVAGNDENHPVSGLLELAADLMSRYEQAHHAIKAATPKDALLLLITDISLDEGEPDAP